MVKSMNPVTLPDSIYQDLSLGRNNRVYRLFVGGLNSSSMHSAKRPIVVILDGNWLFASVYEYLRTLSIFDADILDPIVVGIGYPTDETQALLRLREGDLVPTKDNFAGIDSFSRFIVEDVPRHLENVFGITAGKTLLAGHSWGGAFALYMMASAKSTFDGYLASSPPILDTSLEQVDDFVKNLKFAKNTKLFLSFGACEGPNFADITEGVPLLNQSLDRHGPDNLQHRLIVLDDETHSSISLPAMSKGLRYLLQR